MIDPTRAGAPLRLCCFCLTRAQPSPRRRRVLRIKAVTIGFLASMLLPLVAHAQGGSQGSILGYVYDQTGNPIKGVKVVATSPTMIGGSKSAYSNDEGFFRFNALFPGTFEVRATA